jgi:ubiquinone/menaquinone biosynthesis C-methylase UbiE
MRSVGPKRQGTQMTKKYVHGYLKEEQDRLVSQAQYWKELILHETEMHPGERICEIGCGVGAVLGILHDKFNDISLSGIDISLDQIEYAKNYLTSKGISHVDLKVGDAESLPWHENNFDQVFMIWIVEHFLDNKLLFGEAHRVLKPGGKISVTETDYTTIAIYPHNKDFDYLMEKFIEYFNLFGNSYVGQSLGSALEMNGFVEVTNQTICKHFWNNSHNDELRNHINYLLKFIEPELEKISKHTGSNLQKLQNGVEAFRSTITNPRGSISHLFYKATAKKAQPANAPEPSAR